ncbi:F-box only protein 40-like [Mytilus trossulus]|uniref:F-box only protein 40-like n=1 Tax=Mytilus trossulus TaxID=6551 RepID=UPI00300692A4
MILEKQTNGRIYFTKKRKLSDSCQNEQMKVIIQRLHDQITEKEGIMHMMSRTQQKSLTIIDYLMTRIGVPPSGIGIQSENIEGWLVGDSGIEPEESRGTDQPEGSVVADPPKESSGADQSEESEKCDEGLPCSSGSLPNVSKGSRMLCNGVQPDESDDHQTSRIWIQPKPNGRCQISGNEVELHTSDERVEPKESCSLSNDQLMRMLSMEDDVFSSKEPHSMDYILDEMKRKIIQNKTMTPAEVSRFLDILLEIVNDRCQLETKDHKHCSDCVNQECYVMSGSHSCEMFLCKCGRRMHVCKLEDHKVICLSEEVECINKSNGCETTLLRSDLVAHLEKCPASVLVCSLNHGIYQEKCRECKEVKIPNANIGSCQHFQKCHEFIRRDEMSWHLKNVHIDICEELFGAHALVCPYKISGCTYTAVKHLPDNMHEIEDSISKENVGKNRSTDMPENIFIKSSHIINWYLKALNINHVYSTNSLVKNVCQSVCTPEDVIIPIWEKELSSWSLVRFKTMSTGSFSPIQKWKHCDTRAYFRHISLCPYKPKVDEKKEETKKTIINCLTIEYVTSGMGNK